MDDDEIDRFIGRGIPEDVSEAVKTRFRDLRKNPPDEGNAAETTIDDLAVEQSQSLFYEFDLDDSWEHHIELQVTRDGSLDGVTIVDERGDAPPQYSGNEK